jgi:hypothetical protein
MCAIKALEPGSVWPGRARHYKAGQRHRRQGTCTIHRRLVRRKLRRLTLPLEPRGLMIAPAVVGCKRVRQRTLDDGKLETRWRCETSSPPCSNEMVSGTWPIARDSGVVEAIPRHTEIANILANRPVAESPSDLSRFLVLTHTRSAAEPNSTANFADYCAIRETAEVW